MFLSLFHALRALRVPVSVTEWLTLLEGLSKGLHKESLNDFYYLSRSLLVKDVAYYDAFDQAFAHCFKGQSLPEDLVTREQILEWLQGPLAPLRLSPEQIEEMKALSLPELLRELEKRLQEQEKPHHGGQKWIGTGGTSPYGANGSHPSGVSFAAQGSGGRAALQAVARRYRNLRNDLTLDVRQISVALKRLRDLRDCGAEEALDLDATIDKTCHNGGEIDLVFAREPQNQIRLLLVMDSGGSMEPFRNLSERLFSAANKLNHFKDFRTFYFHNCVYDKLYTNLETGEFVPTAEVLLKCAKTYRLIMVGDAAMSPYELFYHTDLLDHLHTRDVQGIDWLRQLSEVFPRRAWMNPLPENSWAHYETVPTVGALFPMFPLTLEGLTRAVRHLR
ncbi:VWA domain-containing protein [Desulfuromonas sp. TF]|uniref:vWA domain-containing protein n=1 Tax=Desulfuromonas sp. TF TaxID=1232410 RepID=UPI000406D96D|nr:VWA domain-containing protein [Desulfuromonas sp. TF]